MSLSNKAARGAMWTIAASTGSRVIGVLGTVVLTRYLTPAEVGDVQVAGVLASSVATFASVGVLPYISAKPDAPRDVLFHITLLDIVPVAIGLVALMLARDWVVSTFGTAGASSYVPLMALAVSMTTLSLVPERVLMRDLRLSITAMGRAAGELAYSAVSVGLAIFGIGPMSIVYGNLARSGLLLTTFWVAADRRDWLTPCRLSWKTTRHLLGFGLPMAVGGWAHHVARRWDNLLFARFFGSRTVGLYNYAHSLADIPAAHIGEHVGDALLPSFGRMDLERRKAALVRSTALLTLVVFPFAIGLGAVSETAIKAIFESKWWAMAPMVAILSAMAVARPVGWTIMVYLQARLHTKTLMGLEIVKAALLLAGVAALAPLGVLWSCAGVGIAFGLDSLLGVFVVQRRDQISMWKILGGMLPQLIACAPMVAAVIGMRRWLISLGMAQGWLMLLIEVLVGGLAFVPAALLIAPGVSRDFLDVLKAALDRRR